MSLTKAQVDEFRARLVEVRNKLDAYPREDLEQEPQTARGGSDRGDESFAEMWTHLHLSSAIQRDEAYAQVRQALKRIDQGVYGVCIECGADIGLKRLEANPITPRCITCQARFEDDRSERDATPSL